MSLAVVVFRGESESDVGQVWNVIGWISDGVASVCVFWIVCTQ